MVETGPDLTVQVGSPLCGVQMRPDPMFNAADKGVGREELLNMRGDTLCTLLMIDRLFARLFFSPF